MAAGSATVLRPLLQFNCIWILPWFLRQQMLEENLNTAFVDGRWSEGGYISYTYQFISLEFYFYFSTLSSFSDVYQRTFSKLYLHRPNIKKCCVKCARQINAQKIVSAINDSCSILIQLRLDRLKSAHKNRIPRQRSVACYKTTNMQIQNRNTKLRTKIPRAVHVNDYAFSRQQSKMK